MIIQQSDREGFSPGSGYERLPTGLEKEDAKRLAEQKERGGVPRQQFEVTSAKPTPTRKKKTEDIQTNADLGKKHKRLPPSDLEHCGGGSDWESERTKMLKERDEAQSARKIGETTMVGATASIKAGPLPLDPKGGPLSGAKNWETPPEELHARK